MKAIIIDDNPDIRHTIRFALAHLGGWEVIEAADGSHGLQAALAEAPDLVLLDVMMPGLDGRAVMATLRQDPRTAAIPIVFLTAKALPSELRQLESLGALGVMSKPFDPLSLSDELLALLQPAANTSATARGSKAQGRVGPHP